MRVLALAHHAIHQAAVEATEHLRPALAALEDLDVLERPEQVEVGVVEEQPVGVVGLGQVRDFLPVFEAISVTVTGSTVSWPSSTQKCFGQPP